MGILSKRNEGEEMICPVMSGKFNGLREQPFEFDCRKEECAWWDEGEKQCCVKTASVMQTIDCVLQ